MLTTLAAGTLVRDPESRTSAAGKSYATALLRVPCEGEDAALVSVVAFSENACTALLALAKGDSVAVTGRAKLTSWTARDGEQKHGISVVADGVLSQYQVDKRRARARGESENGKAPAAELDRVARAQAATGRAQVLTKPAEIPAGSSIAEMADDIPF